MNWSSFAKTTKLTKIDYQTWHTKANPAIFQKSLDTS